MDRIYILGTIGSGKTTLARTLSSRLNIPAYDLDDLFWKRKFDIKRNEEERERLLKKIVRRKRWIIEGVYSSWVDDILARTELVILLDFPFYRLLFRILRRYFSRLGDHKESFSDVLVLLKCAFFYRRKEQKAGYHEHIGLINKHKVAFVHLKDKKEVDELVNSLSSLP